MAKEKVANEIANLIIESANGDPIKALIDLGSEHRTLIREKCAFENMLRANVIYRIGKRNIAKSGGGESEKLDSTEIAKAFKKYVGERDVTDKQVLNFLIRNETIIGAYDITEAKQRRIADLMGKELAKMSVAEWVKNQKGAGLNMVAKFIAEAGRDLSKFESPAKLWAWFGLSVLNGGTPDAEAPRRKAGVPLGYSIYRRSVAWQLGDCLIKGGGEWKAVYDRRKAYEVEQAEAMGLKVVPSASIPKKKGAEFRSQGHVHARAKRYMEKQFIRSLWLVWTGAEEVHQLPEFVRKSTENQSLSALA